MTRALGVDPDVEVDLFVEEPRPGDRYLLCSDGLPRELRDDHIVSILHRFADPEEAAKELVDEAKRRGGNDNITAVVVDVVDTDSSEAPAPEPEKDPTVVVLTTPPEPSPAAEPRDAEPERRKPTAKMITLRVVAFIGVLVLVVALAAVAIGWYARASYFVGLRGDRVTIYQGRPGGVLWFHPTVAQRTDVATGEVLPHQIPRLRAGQEESSLADARAFVRSLVAEANSARSAQSPNTTGPSSSVPTPSATSPPPTT